MWGLKGPLYETLTNTCTHTKNTQSDLPITDTPSVHNIYFIITAVRRRRFCAGIIEFPLPYKQEQLYVVVLLIYCDTLFGGSLFLPAEDTERQICLRQSPLIYKDRQDSKYIHKIDRHTHTQVYRGSRLFCRIWLDLLRKRERGLRRVRPE